MAMASLLFSSPALPCLRSRSRCFQARSTPRRRPHAGGAALFRGKSDRRRPPGGRRLVIHFALAESDSPKALEQEALLPLLQEIADSLVLPADYLEKLPQDLRLDLNDAAFDLSNGPVFDECGQELGALVSSLARSWEKAETSTSCSIASKLPSLHNSLNDGVKSAIGKRLLSAGRRFQGMGQYGEGELQRIARAMTKAGKVLSASSVTSTEPKTEARMLKFGDLQLELTAEKANIGAAIGFLFGIISWGLSQGIQSIPESSLQYANDNALLLAKSLRGALLAMCYSSALLSSATSVGLLFLGRQLGDSKDK